MYTHIYIYIMHIVILHPHENEVSIYKIGSSKIMHMLHAFAVVSCLWVEIQCFAVFARIWVGLARQIR